MNKQRETTTLKIGSHEVVAYTYVTGLDLRNIENAAYKSVEMRANKNADDFRITTGQIMAAREDEAIKAIIVSVDGNTSVVEAVLALRAEDYNAVLDYVKSLTEKKASAGTPQNSLNTAPVES